MLRPWPRLSNEHNATARTDQGRNLVPPVPAVAEAAVEQDHRVARPVGREPYPCAVVVHVALFVGNGQRRGTVRHKARQVVVVRFHIYGSNVPKTVFTIES